MPWQVRYPNWGVRRAIAVSPTGNIVVGGGEGGTLWHIDEDEEPGRNSIQWSSRDRGMQVRVFATTGRLLDTWGVFATVVNTLQGLACDSSGNILTSERYTDQVKIFSEGGEFLGLVGAPARSSDSQLRRPSRIAVDATGRVFVADRGNNRVQIFDPNGVSLGHWGSEGNGDGQFAGLEGIAIDSSGRIYTVESDNNRVQVFTREGTFLKKWGASGSETGQFKYPTDINHYRSIRKCLRYRPRQLPNTSIR